MPAGDFEIEFVFEGEEYKLPTLMLAEARAIQKVTGFTVVKFWEALSAADADAITALIWVARRRQDFKLRFEDVDGDMSTFEVTGPENGEPEAGEEGKDPEPSPTGLGPSSEAG